MTAFPAADAFRDAVNQGVGKQVVEDLIAAATQLLGASARSTLTIAAGIITPTHALHAIDTEAAAASDSLTNAALANHPVGRLLRLSSVSAARVVWLEHANGGDGELILLDGIDLPLTDPRSWVMFERVGTAWVEVDRFIADRPATGYANLLDNSDGLINQDGDTPAGLADNAYGTDCWRVLSNGGTCNWIGLTTFIPSGARSRLTVQTATANVKFAMFSVIPAWKTIGLRGQSLLLSGLLSVSDARISNVKAAILEWTGAANGTQGDPVSAWNADGVNPTLAANWAYLTTPVNLNVGVGPLTSPTFVGPIAAEVGAAANNIAVLIWSDDVTVNVGDAINATNLNLHRGRVLLPYEYRPREAELAACLSRYYKTHGYGVAPAANTGFTGALSFTQMVGASLVVIGGNAYFPTPMIFSPAVTSYNPSVAANAQIRNSSASTNYSGTTVDVIDIFKCRVLGTTAAGSVAGNHGVYHLMADARL